MKLSKSSKVNALLASVMLMVILLVCSSQVQADQEGDFTYTITGGEAQITGYTGSGGAVAIPDTLGGVGVTSIGSDAFYGCTCLTSITIPAGATSIASRAFFGCTGLTSITVDNSNPNYSSKDGVLYNKTGNSLLAFPGGLTSITIPGGVTSIGDYAFCNCTGLTSVTIPAGVTSIGIEAFFGCTDLTSIIVPVGVISISYEAFGGCTGLTSITVDNSNPSYSSKDGVLYNKTGDILLAFPGGLTSITIPGGVTSIGNDAFGGCTGLTSITIPDEVTSIGQRAFESCRGLTSIIIPAGVTSISDRAFANCTGLTSITIPAKVTSIGNGAFCDCEGMTSITIPVGVTSIGNSAFFCCNSLAAISFYSAATAIYDDPSTIPTQATIKGYAGSTAEAYATKYGRTFELISGTLPVTLDSIAITTPAAKLSYSVGDTLDLTGLVVTGTYSDTSTKAETIAVANVTGFNSTTAAANQVLTITVGGKTATYTVQIAAAAATLQSIAITHTAAKLNYTVGDSLDITGLEVTGTYSDGSTNVETITAADVTGFDSIAAAADQVLTITVGGKTATYTVQITAAAATLQSIAITHTATKLNYTVGDSLDITGLEVTGTYSDGSNKVETITAANVTGFNSTAAAANQVLTITVGGKTATYKVQILATAATLQSIAITHTAAKLNYTVGDSLDIAGLVVTGTYSDTSTKVETITAANVTGFNSTAAAANQVLTITVGGKTTTYTVQIAAATSMPMSKDANNLADAYDGSYSTSANIFSSGGYIIYKLSDLGLSSTTGSKYTINAPDGSDQCVRLEYLDSDLSTIGSTTLDIGGIKNSYKVDIPSAAVYVKINGASSGSAIYIYEIEAKGTATPAPTIGFKYANNVTHACDGSYSTSANIFNRNGYITYILADLGLSSTTGSKYTIMAPDGSDQSIRLDYLDIDLSIVGSTTLDIGGIKNSYKVSIPSHAVYVRINGVSGSAIYIYEIEAGNTPTLAPTIGFKDANNVTHALDGSYSTSANIFSGNGYITYVLADLGLSSTTGGKYTINAPDGSDQSVGLDFLDSDLNIVGSTTLDIGGIKNSYEADIPPAAVYVRINGVSGSAIYIYEIQKSTP